MIKSTKSEEWKELRMPKGALRYRYAISSLGRIASFTTKIQDGKILNGTSIGGYPTLNVKPFGENKTYYIHKLVAELFLKKSSPKQKFVIHKNHDKLNNQAVNLKWATRDMVADHNRKNPNVINMVIPKSDRHYKLSEANVKAIKMMLRGDGTVVTAIAREFGITPTQVNRIKNGQNWGHVTID